MLAVVIVLFNWFIRYKNGPAAVIPTGLAMSVMAVIILGFTGWKGGTLVYQRRIGVADQMEDHAPPIMMCGTLFPKRDGSLAHSS